MNIKELTIKRLRIPFKVSFSHAQAKRIITDSVIVTAQSKNHFGYGESCPRSYVTNETYESVISFFYENKLSVMNDVFDIQSLKDWVNTNSNIIDKNPAAWCAIELALLDMLAKENDFTVEHLLGLTELSGEFQYTAVLGDSREEEFKALLKRYWKIGFTDFKIKLSGNIDKDKIKCDALSELVDSKKIRLDANNLWNNHDEALTYIHDLGHHYFAIEEPIQVNDYDGLSLIAKELKMNIILDESFIKHQQFDFISGPPSGWIINIRVSKMGGLIRSIAIAEKAKTLGIRCIVGAQVGETSLLTRAALTLVNSFRETIIAQEGAYGTQLLEHDYFQPSIMFGHEGKLSFNQNDTHEEKGFGLIEIQ